MNKLILFTLLFFAISLFTSCDDEHFNSPVIIEDNISLLQKGTKELLANHKCPDDIIIIIRTVDSIRAEKVIEFGNDMFDGYSDTIPHFKKTGVLILASRKPGLVQMRVGENFKLMSQNYGIYPGKDYFDAQQTAYVHGLDYAVTQTFLLALKNGNVNAELNFTQRSNQNKAAAIIYGLLSDLTTPKDTFIFNVFFKYPFKLAFKIIEWTGSLINMLLLILIFIVIINILVFYVNHWAMKRKGFFTMILSRIFKTVLVYIFITASLSAVFFISIPAIENFILIDYFKLGDVSTLSGLYGTDETGSSILFGVIFLILFVLTIIIDDPMSVVYSSTSFEFQQKLFNSMDKEEQWKLNITNSLNGATAASIEDFKKHPFLAVLSSQIGKAIAVTGTVLLISLFLLSKPILLILILITLNTFIKRSLKIFELSKIAKKKYSREMKNNVNVVSIICASLILIFVTISAISLAMSKFNIDYDKTREISSAKTELIDENWILENKNFLENNKKKKGVITLPSGLQYKIVKRGHGKKPTLSNRVKLHYTGKLIDGTVLDSSIERGEPAVFGTGQVIKGLTEALHLMPVGSKWTLYIPSELAYGDHNTGAAKPHSTLVFDVELLEIMK